MDRESPFTASSIRSVTLWKALVPITICDPVEGISPHAPWSGDDSTEARSIILCAASVYTELLHLVLCDLITGDL